EDGIRDFHVTGVQTCALPIFGNGKLGAMVYGNVQTERIQLNEHTLWSGSPNRNDNPLALDSLETIRRLIFEGKQKQAENLANKEIGRASCRERVERTVRTRAG